METLILADPACAANGPEMAQATKRPVIIRRFFAKIMLRPHFIITAPITEQIARHFRREFKAIKKPFRFKRLKNLTRKPRKDGTKQR
jgi:hypothetical protein